MTSLNLLAREGGVCVTFHTLLSPPQYDELYGSVKAASSIVELEGLIAKLAHSWECQATVVPFK